MHAKDILIDAYTRIQEEVHAAVEGLTLDDLHRRPGPDANSVAWLVWHLTRVQDDHVAGAFDLEQVWLTQDWEKRFGLDLKPHDIGYGHTSAQVAKVRVDSADLLTGYYDAVHAQSIEALRGRTARVTGGSQRSSTTRSRSLAAMSRSRSSVRACTAS